ncbi:hypothetical protein DERP_010894 [Dermatophagoides pteronyssinus]|uniref:Uncharacterized protein n=1 Tax=Dermatophagoides pteronyssinus TaxID=6956 RepID=A0ABQ8JVJ1_DERPT|nr:hypothetical protein DERP_010894 [Dermatophagoides pteronyssinus]
MVLFIYIGYQYCLINLLLAIAIDCGDCCLNMAIIFGLDCCFLDLVLIIIESLQLTTFAPIERTIVSIAFNSILSKLLTILLLMIPSLTLTLLLLSFIIFIQFCGGLGKSEGDGVTKDFEPANKSFIISVFIANMIPQKIGFENDLRPIYPANANE